MTSENLGKWRPLCYGLQYAEQRDSCSECPFQRSCKQSFKARQISFRPKRMGRGE